MLGSVIGLTYSRKIRYLVEKRDLLLGLKCHLERKFYVRDSLSEFSYTEASVNPITARLQPIWMSLDLIR